MQPEATERQLALDLGAINTGIFDPTNIAIHVAQNAVNLRELWEIFFRRQMQNYHKLFQPVKILFLAKNAEISNIS